MKKIIQTLNVVMMGFLVASCCGTTVGNGEQCSPELEGQQAPGSLDILQYISTEGGFSILFPSAFTIATNATQSTVTINDFNVPAPYSFNSQLEFTILEDLPSDLMAYAQASGLCPGGAFVQQSDIANANGVVCYIEDSQNLLQAIYLLEGLKLIQATVSINHPNVDENLMLNVLKSFTSHGP